MKNKLLTAFLFVAVFFVIHGNANENQKHDKAMIDLSPNKPVQKLFPLTLISINGESVIHRDDMIMLAPGQYQLKFASNIDLNFFPESTRIIKSKINQRKYQDSLIIKVDAGNIYKLAFDARSKKVEEWKPIILNTGSL